jgi:hypothetical protein
VNSSAVETHFVSGKKEKIKFAGLNEFSVFNSVQGIMWKFKANEKLKGIASLQLA